MKASLLPNEGGTVEDLDQIRLPGKDGFLWVWVRGGEERVEDLQEAFDIPDRLMKFLQERPQAPAFAVSPRAVAVALFSIDRRFPPLAAHPLVFMVGDGWIVTLTWDEDLSVQRAWNDRKGLLPLGADLILLEVLDPLLDTYGELVNGLIHRAEVIDALVLKGAPRLYEDIHRIRQQALSLRKVVQPELDALSLLKDHHLRRPSSGEPYMEDLLIRLRRLADDIDGVRDGMMAVVESYASVVANRMNRAMKLLTVVSVVFLPPTLIASIYGMNFAIPEYHWPLGYWYSLGLMVMVSAGILFYMQAKGWFR